MRRRKSFLNCKLCAFSCAFLLVVVTVGGQSFGRAEGEATGQPGQAPLKVFVCAGQSNMVGKRSQARRLPDALRGEAQGILVFDAKSRKWTPMQPPRRGFGPEVSFAHAMYEELDEPVGIIKCSRGGTSLAADWNPATPGPLYTRLKETVKAAQGTRSIEIVGMLWMQGEKDSKNREFAPQYAELLPRLTADLRQCFANEEMPFVAGRVNPPEEKFPYVEAVRKAQEQCAADSYVWVNCDGLTKQGDDLHYDTKGQVELGLLFAGAMQRLMAEGLSGAQTTTAPSAGPPGDVRREYAPLIEQMSSRFLEDRQAGIEAVLSKSETERRAMLPLMVGLLGEDDWPVQWSAAQVLKHMAEDAAPVRKDLANLLAGAACGSDWGLFTLTREALLSIGPEARDTVPVIADGANEVEGNIARAVQRLLEKLKAGDNRPPEIKAADFTALEGEPATFEINVSDPDDLDCLVEIEVTERPKLGEVEQQGNCAFRYSVPLGKVGEDRFVCKAKDSSGTYSAPRSFRIRVEPDTTPPRIGRVLAAGIKDRVIVRFSKPVRVESAGDVGAYQIDNGVEVKAASRREDPYEVELTTSELRTGVKYTLKIAGVRDVTKTGNPVQDSAQFSFTKGQPGVACAYYEFEGESPSTREDFDALEPDKRGIVPRIEPSLRERDEHFAMRFDGFLAIAKEGEYRFFMTADDEGALFIDGEQVASKTQDGSVRLDPGMHALCVTYAQHAWAFDLKVEWEGPDLPRQVLPETVLFHGE